MDKACLKSLRKCFKNSLEKVRKVFLTPFEAEFSRNFVTQASLDV